MSRSPTVLVVISLLRVGLALAPFAAFGAPSPCDSSGGRETTRGRRACPDTNGSSPDPHPALQDPCPSPRARSSTLAPRPHITIQVTDFDINQWNPQLDIGGDLSAAENRLFPAGSGVVGIAVPMPPDAAFNTLSDPAFRAQIRTAVGAIVREALRKNRTAIFEIQLRQNIHTSGYFDGAHPKAVDRFAAITCSALGDVIAELGQAHHPVSSRAFTLSNGTKILASIIDSLYGDGKPYLDSADLVNRRAMLERTSDLITAFGERNMSLLATRGDLPAPSLDQGLPSTGSFETLVHLKDRHPGVKTYLLTPVGPTRMPQENHLAPLPPPSGSSFTSTLETANYSCTAAIQEFGQALAKVLRN